MLSSTDHKIVYGVYLRVKGKEKEGLFELSEEEFIVQLDRLILEGNDAGESIAKIKQALIKEMHRK